MKPHFLAAALVFVAIVSVGCADTSTDMTAEEEANFGGRQPTPEELNEAMQGAPGAPGSN